MNGKDERRLSNVIELRAKELIENAKQVLRVMLELSVAEEGRLVNDDGASLSSDSLRPSPVVTNTLPQGFTTTTAPLPLFGIPSVVENRDTVGNVRSPWSKNYGGWR